MGKFGACVDSTLTWIGNNKLSSFLIVCLFAFIVSTWTLAAINADLKRQLQEKNSNTDTTATPSETTTTTTAQADPTTETTTTLKETEETAHRIRRYA